MIEQRETEPTVSRLRPLEPPPEQAVNVQRYANALRRSRGLIAAIVLGLTALVLWLSLMLPKTYTAQATILFDETPSVTATTDAHRQLATIQKLLMTHDMLAISAKQLRTTVGALTSKVHATVDPNANIVSISASASTPKAAARTANAVAAGFLARERDVELAPIKTAKLRLTNAIEGSYPDGWIGSAPRSTAKPRYRYSVRGSARSVLVPRLRAQSSSSRTAPRLRPGRRPRGRCATRRSPSWPHSSSPSSSPSGASGSRRVWQREGISSA